MIRGKNLTAPPYHCANRVTRFAVGRVMKFCRLPAFLFVGVAVACGASAPKKPVDESGPVLMSKTGGGKTWSNIKELQKAANDGNPRAQAQLGERLLRGEDIAADRVAGMVMLEKAARAGESSAAFRLGMLYDDGDGVPQDRARAFAYFKAAAAGGAKEAFYNIGSAYVSARGVKRDYTEGLAWLILAKKNGASSEGESAVRERLQKTNRADQIAAAEKRAPELEKELAGKKPQEFLPPAAAAGPATTAAIK